MSDYSDPQLTPNGKVSKAKKGKPVHVCTECQKVRDTNSRLGSILNVSGVY